MKFDREIVIGIVICAIILFGWGPLARSLGWMPAEPQATAQTQTTEKTAPDTADAKPETKNEVPPAPTEAVKEAKTANAEKTAGKAAENAATSPAPATAAPSAKPIPQLPEIDPVVLENPDIRVTINPNTGAVTAIQLNDYKITVPLEKKSGFFRMAEHPDQKKAAPVVINTVEKGISSGALDLEIKDKTWYTAAVKPAPVKTVPEGGSEFTLERKMINANSGDGFTVTQTWKIGKDGYRIDYEIVMTNDSGREIPLPSMTVGGGVLGSSKQVSGDEVRGDAHYLEYMTAAGDYNDIAADAGFRGGCSSDKGEDKFRAIGNPAVRWAGLSNKYFCLILKSGKAKEDFRLVCDRTFSECASDDGKPEKFAVPSVGMTVSDGSETLPAGKPKTYTFDYYCGPKVLKNLNSFDDSASKVMHLSMGPLNYLARFMLWILVKLHALIGSYGVSIILLTLIVRLIFYPITARGNASMKKMQAVQPKLKELREKYKDNPQLMNTKMMELYRAEGINPLGGCLPILLQIPVFLGLYSAFNGAVELRQTSFLWCHNLAAADTVAYVSILPSVQMLSSIPINPLVIVMTGLMVLQQHMTPMSMEPSQKKMMMLMPIVMLFLFYNLPSGLTLYWTVSNIFSIIQLRLQQRGSKKNETAQAAKN